MSRAKCAKFGESVNGFFVVEFLNFAGLAGLARGNPIRKINMSPKDAQFGFVVISTEGRNLS